MRPARTASAIDAVAESYLSATVSLSPLTATALGLPGADDRLDDFSPAGLAAAADLDRATVRRLATEEPVDDVDRVTLEAMRERLGVGLERHEAGIPHMSLNVLECPLQAVRDVLDLMPTDTPQQWEVVADRMAAIPAALAQWHDSLLYARSRGLVAPRRQVLACIAQAQGFASADGYFGALLERERAAGHAVPQAVAARVEQAATTARAGYAECAARLRDDLLEVAPAADACGRELYELHSRFFLGARIDLAETYAWGTEELARIRDRMRQLSRRIAPDALAGADAQDLVGAARDRLDADERYRLRGTEALVAWMQEQADRAVAALAPVHFDIPEPLRRIECRVAPTQTGGIYYTGPSDDLSRPGMMWWSVPRGVTTFSTWQELTTVYHEGVPGHHLQIGQTVLNSGQLNRWRRLLSWTSGHGEGWALYAEQLMAELGFLDDPGNRLGMLDAQSLRAARVVIDIGVHCGFEVPAQFGGGPWSYDAAWRLLRDSSLLPEEILRFELDRYLGWPGQAAAYKVGERLWRSLRDEVAAAEGAAFDLRGFHRRALDVGGVGLDTLRRAVLGRWPDGVADDPRSVAAEAMS